MIWPFRARESEDDSHEAHVSNAKTALEENRKKGEELTEEMRRLNGSLRLAQAMEKIGISERDDDVRSARSDKKL